MSWLIKCDKMNPKENYDVIVVGGGPAGTSTAKTCADLGLSVAVFERNAEIGSPKRCGEGLSANSVKRLGLKIPQRCIAQKIYGAYVYAPNGKEVKIKFKGTEGFVLERKVFDKWLASQASRSGVDIFCKSNVFDVIKGKANAKTITNRIFGPNFVSGVNVETIDGIFSVFSKVVVAADGVESMVARKVGLRTNKNPLLIDSGFQYEMAGIDLRDSHMIELFFGNKIAYRGYVWIFPKGADIANVGIGISGAHKEKTAKQYLDEFVASREELKNGSIIEVNAGAIPVGGFMKNMVSDGLVLVGDAANQVNPIHGGGIAESITAGRMAGNVIKKAIEKNDVSEKSLSEYNKIWWKERGNHLLKVEKVREMFEKMDDNQLNDLAEILSGEDLSEFARGRRLPKLIKIAAKLKIHGVMRKIGV